MWLSCARTRARARIGVRASVRACRVPSRETSVRACVRARIRAPIVRARVRVRIGPACIPRLHWVYRTPPSVSSSGRCVCPNTCSCGLQRTRGWRGEGMRGQEGKDLGGRKGKGVRAELGMWWERDGRRNWRDERTEGKDERTEGRTDAREAGGRRKGKRGVTREVREAHAAGVRHGTAERTPDTTPGGGGRRGPSTRASRTGTGTTRAGAAVRAPETAPLTEFACYSE